jgi:hypothetical protein
VGQRQQAIRDPKSLWQRGSNENTNGLLPQYLPRTLDFRTLTQDDFDAIAAELNAVLDRPARLATSLEPLKVLINPYLDVGERVAVTIS